MSSISSNYSIRERVSMDLRTRNVSDIVSALIELKEDWCRDGSSELLAQFDDAIREIREPEFPFDGEPTIEETKIWALVTEACNKLAHHLRTRGRFDDSARIRGNILFDLKDEIMGRGLVPLCIKYGFKCGTAHDYGSDIGFFGVFIPRIGELRWHLGNEQKTEAMNARIYEFVRQFGASSRQVTYLGNYGKGESSNLAKLNGEGSYKEYRKDAENWGVGVPNPR